MKPTVFNYQEYERVVEENKKLNAEVADLRIRCRIADGDKRDCKSCKHQKPDGCSRWDCEYEPMMVEVVRCEDCKWHLNGHLCKQLSQYGSIETPPSFYCGFGERREP